MTIFRAGIGVMENESTMKTAMGIKIQPVRTIRTLFWFALILCILATPRLSAQGSDRLSHSSEISTHFTAHFTPSAFAVNQTAASNRFTPDTELFPLQLPFTLGTRGIWGPRLGQTQAESVSSAMLCRAQQPDVDLPVYYLPQNESVMPEQTFYGAGLSEPFSDWLETDNAEPEYQVTMTDQWADPWADPASAYPPPMFESRFLPEGFIYPSYLAGRKEPRMQTLFTHEDGYGWLWDITLGGRVPMYRYGTAGPIAPEGFQIDIEGAAMLRLDFERDRQLAATDYRAGLPLTYGTKHWQYKFAYYHISSHLGDNYLLDGFREKKRYVRDELVVGLAWRPIEPVRIYGEVGWAFHVGDTTKPWEFQLGAEYSPVYRPQTAKTGTPFAAVHGHLFEELDFGGYLNLQIGWQWRSRQNARFRFGVEFYDGCDDQFQFHALHQRKYGVGLWYDF